ncbi:unnamed protein product, partial [Cyprideis torosa]
VLFDIRPNVNQWLSLSRTIAVEPSLRDKQEDQFPQTFNSSCFTVGWMTVETSTGLLHVGDAEGDWPCMIMDEEVREPQRTLFDETSSVDLRDQHLGMFIIRYAVSLPDEQMYPFHIGIDGVLVHIQEIIVLGKSFVLQDRTSGDNYCILTVRLGRAAADIPVSSVIKREVLRNSLTISHSTSSVLSFLMLRGDTELALYPFLEIGRTYWVVYPSGMEHGERHFFRSAKEGIFPWGISFPGVSQRCVLPLGARILDSEQPVLPMALQSSVSEVMDGVENCLLGRPKLLESIGWFNVAGILREVKKSDTGAMMSTGEFHLILEDIQPNNSIKEIRLYLKNFYDRFQRCFPGGLRTAVKRSVVLSNVILRRSERTGGLYLHCTELSAMFLAPNRFSTAESQDTLGPASDRANLPPEKLLAPETSVASRSDLNRPRVCMYIADILLDPEAAASHRFRLEGRIFRILSFNIVQICPMCSYHFDIKAERCSSPACENRKSDSVRIASKFLFSDGTGIARLISKTETAVHLLNKDFVSKIRDRMRVEKISEVHLSSFVKESSNQSEGTDVDPWRVEKRKLLGSSCFESMVVVVEVRVFQKDVVVRRLPPSLEKLLSESSLNSSCEIPNPRVTPSQFILALTLLLKGKSIQCIFGDSNEHSRSASCGYKWLEELVEVLEEGLGDCGCKTDDFRWPNAAEVPGYFVKIMDKLLTSLQPVLDEGQEQLQKWSFMKLNVELIRELIENVLGHVVSLSHVVGRREKAALGIMIHKWTKLCSELESNNGRMSSADIELNRDLLVDALELLEEQFNFALLSLVADTFKDVLEPLRPLIRGHSESSTCEEDKTRAFIEAVDEKTDDIMNCLSFAISCSSDQAKCQQLSDVRFALGRLEEVLVPACMSLSDSDPLPEHDLRILRTCWSQELKKAWEALSSMIHLPAFAQAINFRLQRLFSKLEENISNGEKHVVDAEFIKPLEKQTKLSAAYVKLLTQIASPPVGKSQSDTEELRRKLIEAAEELTACMYRLSILKTNAVFLSWHKRALILKRYSKIFSEHLEQDSRESSSGEADMSSKSIEMHTKSPPDTQKLPEDLQSAPPSSKIGHRSFNKGGTLSLIVLEKEEQEHKSNIYSTPAVGDPNTPLDIFRTGAPVVSSRVIGPGFRAKENSMSLRIQALLRSTPRAVPKTTPFAVTDSDKSCSTRTWSHVSSIVKDMSQNLSVSPEEGENWNQCSPPSSVRIKTPQRIKDLHIVQHRLRKLKTDVIEHICTP